MSRAFCRFSFVFLFSIICFDHLSAQISCPSAETPCSVTENPFLPEGAHHKWADLNMDGELDLVQWQENSQFAGELVYYINTGSGFAANNMKSVASGFQDFSIQVYFGIGDLDNDLRPDLLVVRGTMVGYSFEVHLNQGNNNFSTSSVSGFVPYPTIGNSNNIFDPLIGDVDNDGDQDFIFCSDDCYLFRNLGDGAFERDENFCLDLETNVAFTQAFLADLDKDGYLDLIGTETLEQRESTSHTVTWFSGVGVDCDDCLVHETLDATYVFDIGDIDNDGDLDLLVQEELFFVQNGGGNSTGTKILFNNCPEAGFTELEIDAINDCINDVLDAQWVDIDNDGDLDIAAYDDIGVCIFRNDNLDFFKIFDFSVQIPIKLTMVFGDYNNDNQMDFCGLQDNGDSFFSTYYCNFQDCGANQRPGPPSNLTHVSYPGHGDVLLEWNPAFDNNQDNDGLTYNLSISNGENIISPLSSQNQGIREIVQIGAQSQNTFHYLNDIPSGTYDWKVQAIDHSYAGGEWSQVETFTIDNCFDFDTVNLTRTTVIDGIQMADITEGEAQHLDFLVGQSGLNIFENLGNLSLAQGRFLETGNQVVVRDLNNDNLLDLIFYSASSISLLINDGLGDFTTGQNYMVSPSKPVVGDIDNDGDRDILFGNGTDNILVIRNLGDGVFSSQPTMLYSGGENGRREPIELFDVDNDGDLDMLTKFTFSIQVGFSSFYGLGWIENVNGFFSEVSTIATSHCGPIAVGDMDSDGDKDIVVATSRDCSVSLSPTKDIYIYKNSGGKFSADTVYVYPCDYYYSHIELGDMDNDGLLDIVGLTQEQSFGDFSSVNSGLVILRNDSLCENGLCDFTEVARFSYNEQFTLGDIDGDYDLDIVYTSCQSLCLEALINQTCIANTVPTPPQSVTCTQEENGILLTWESASDEQQRAVSLSYNIEVYSYDSSGSYIISPESYEDSGVRKIVRFGDQCQNLSWRISGLPEGNYCFRVQAVDHSFVGGLWSEEACCTNEICKDAISLICGQDTIGNTADEGLRDRINDYIWCETNGFTQPELIYRIERDTNRASTADIFISLRELGEETQAGLDVFIIENCNTEDSLVRCVDNIERLDTSGPALLHISNPNPNSEYYVIVDSRSTPGDFRLSTSCPESCEEDEPLTCQQEKRLSNNFPEKSEISAYYIPDSKSYFDGYAGFEYKVSFMAPKDGLYTILLDNLEANLDLFVMGSCNPFQCLASGRSTGTAREEIEVRLLKDQKIYLSVDAAKGVNSSFRLMVDCCDALLSTIFLGDESDEVLICKKPGQVDSLSFFNSPFSEVPYAYILTDAVDQVIDTIPTPYLVSDLNIGEYRVYGVSYEDNLLYDRGQNVNEIEGDICAIISDNFIKITIDTSYEITVDTVLCIGEQVMVCDTILSSSGQHVIACKTINGCDSIVIMNITFDTVTASIEGNTFFCRGESTTLNAFPEDHIYQWSTESAERSITVSEAGVYSLRVTSENGCFDTASVVVEEVEKLLPSLGIDTILCEGETVLLDPGEFDSYRWSTGDTTASISIVAEGLYTVVVTNAAGCLGSDSIMVFYLPVPISNAGADRTICAGECVTLTGRGGSNCFWLPSTDFEGSELCDIEVCPLETTTYTLIVFNAIENTACADTAEVTVFVNAKPEITLVSDTAICAGNGVDLVQNLANCEDCTCLWTVNGSAEPLACDPVVFPGSNTNYQVITTNSNNCQDTAMVTIEVGEAPIAIVDREQIDLCPGDCVVLTGISDDNCIWTDVSGNFLGDDCMLGQVCPDSSTIYRLINSITTNVSTDMEVLICYDTVEVQVNVFNEIGGIVLIEDTTICSGTQLNLVKSIACSNCACEWAPSNGLEGAETCSPVAIPNQNTVYRVISTSPEGCSSSDSVTIMVVETPAANLEFADANICRGDFLILSGSGGDCQWLDADQRLLSRNCDFEVSPDSTKAFLFVVSNTTQITCTDTARLLIAVTEPPLIELVQDTTICQGSSLVLLQSSDCPDCVCSWSTSTGLDSPNSCDPMASPNADITYELSALKNGVCMTSASVTVNVLPSLPVVVKNDQLSVFKNNVTTLLIDTALLKNDIFVRTNQIDLQLIDDKLPAEITLDLDDQNLVVTTGNIVDLYEFSYILRDLDCGSQDTATVLIQVIETDKVSLCNPDIEDGCVVLDDIEMYPGNDIVIFDREGNIVHLRSMYLNDWDGTNIRTGARVPTGAYYFVLNLGKHKITNIDTPPIRGVITIVRR